MLNMSSWRVWEMPDKGNVQHVEGSRLFEGKVGEGHAVVY